MFPRVFNNLHGIVEGEREPVAIPCHNAAFDARRIDINSEKQRVVKCGGKWLSAAHSTHAAGNHQLAGEVPTEVSVGHGGKRFERPLNDALCADIDPTSGSHLAVHHQAFAFEFMEVFPVGPGTDEVRISD